MNKAFNMARINDPKHPSTPNNDMNRKGPDQINPISPEKGPYGPGILGFQQLLAELLARRFLNEHQGEGLSDNPTD
jgi:hypothetical protein